ncbi:xanthine dehydrogenase accessory protein XdhC [Roseibium sp.]|uniref:xanthine dehydrogenase accessory protein XdhC n=1 Tax=Roseibium sp. TaxID=1936156 RepID=UPI003A978E7B
MRVWRHIADILRAGDPCALVTVASVAGSTPREAGARMVVRPDGAFHGTIGGGTLEFQAIRWAQDALNGADVGLTVRAFSLGPDLGQCCGGRVDVAVEVIPVSSLAMACELERAEADGGAVVTRSRIEAGKSLVRERIDAVIDNPFLLGHDGVLTEEFGANHRTLLLFGAGHVGRAVVLALAPLPFKIRWIDNRADAFPAAVPANVTCQHTSDPLECLADARAGSFALIMTHSHALDEELAAKALMRQDLPYVGVIGSATKRARFERRLKTRGLPANLVASMVCPVGSRQVASKSPAAIAAGVALELLIKDEILSSKCAEGLAQPLASGQ